MSRFWTYLITSSINLKYIYLIWWLNTGLQEWCTTIFQLYTGLSLPFGTKQQYSFLFCEIVPFLGSPGASYSVLSLSLLVWGKCKSRYSFMSKCRTKWGLSDAPRRKCAGENSGLFLNILPVVSIQPLPSLHASHILVKRPQSRPKCCSNSKFTSYQVHSNFPVVYRFHRCVNLGKIGIP